MLCVVLHSLAAGWAKTESKTSFGWLSWSSTQVTISSMANLSSLTKTFHSLYTSNRLGSWRRSRERERERESAQFSFQRRTQRIDTMINHAHYSPPVQDLIEGRSPNICLVSRYEEPFSSFGRFFQKLKRIVCFGKVCRRRRAAVRTSGGLTPPRHNLAP